MSQELFNNIITRSDMENTNNLYSLDLPGKLGRYWRSIDFPYHTKVYKQK